MKLLEPLTIGGLTAPNRVLFGPHETNLADGRSISERHAAYYRERATGGCGIIVVEEAAVHPSDWPYERSPLATEAANGWRSVAEACAASDAVVLAGLGHSGGQGSSAFSQREMWAPSDEPGVNSNEVPKIMEQADIDAVVAGFASAAKAAIDAGLDGVEVNGGQNSLLRQFLSGLTNRRDDDYGNDRLRFARETFTAARSAMGSKGILGLRLSCDEMAPWAGLTPESAGEVAGQLAPLVDYLVVVRGSIFTMAETRPTGHHGTGFNLDLASSIRHAISSTIPVFGQGSIVDAAAAEHALDSDLCDGVEMTRAQIADPELVSKLASGRPVRPCVVCNQRCMVRDNRNPIVSCIVEPRSGYETIDPPVAGPDGRQTGPQTGQEARGRQPVLVVGAGPAGLEAARVAARAGSDVTVMDAEQQAGGLLRIVARIPGHDRFAALADWLVGDAEASGVTFELGRRVDAAVIDAWPGSVVLATGARSHPIDLPVADGVDLLTPEQILRATDDTFDAIVPATVSIWDPIGNGVAVGIAELLAARGRAVTFITPDAIAGTLLSLTGDLAGCNVRLQQAGVQIERRQLLRSVGATSVTVEHQFTAVVSEIEGEGLVDCSARLPDDDLWSISNRSSIRVGDAVAARTVGEAIREGRAAGLAVTGTNAKTMVAS